MRQQLVERTEFIEFNQTRRQRFAATASAAGVTLNQTEELFDVLLEDQPERNETTGGAIAAPIAQAVMRAALGS